MIWENAACSSSVIAIANSHDDRYFRKKPPSRWVLAFVYGANGFYDGGCWRRNPVN